MSEAGWQTLSSEVVYETPWIKVRRDEVRNHRGKPLTYSVVELHHPSVCIVALNEVGEVLVQRDFRYTVDEFLWELPAGHSDGQNLLEAAQRELLEEAGLASDDWVQLGDGYPAVGIANAPMAFFLARNVRSVAAGGREDDEQIVDQYFMSRAEIEELARAGKVKSMSAIAGLYLAQIHGAWKEAQ